MLPQVGAELVDALFVDPKKARIVAGVSWAFQLFCLYLNEHCCADRGYGLALRWWYVFFVLFPAFAMLVPRIEGTLRRNLAVLAGDDLAVFRRVRGTASLGEVIAARIKGASSSSSEAKRFGITVVAVTILTLADAWATVRGENVPSIAHERFWGVVVPYLGQAVVVLLMLHWLDRFCRFMAALVRELNDEKGDFAFDPISLDPARRLGLGPLARAFDYLLLVSVLFALYALLVRLELGEWSKGGGLLPNLKAIVTAPIEEAALTASYYQLTPTGAGLVAWAMPFAPALAATIVLGVMVWYPLFRWRAIAGEWKTQVWKEVAVRMRSRTREGKPTAADRRRDAAELEGAQKRLAAVNESTVWPNGYERASTLIGLTALIVLLSWFPNLLKPLVAGAIALRVFGGAQMTIERFTQGR